MKPWSSLLAPTLLLSLAQLSLCDSLVRLPVHQRNFSLPTPFRAWSTLVRRGFVPDTPTAMQLTDVGKDIEYYAEVTVGTPGQVFRLDLDTGSADLWIYTQQDFQKKARLVKERKATPRRKERRKAEWHQMFNAERSATFRATGDPWIIHYVDGSYVRGAVGVDTVELGGINVRQQTIGLATEASKEFKDDVVDGVLGLGFQEISRLKAPPLFQNMISQKLVPNPVFSIFLGRQSEGGGGEIIFGGADSRYYTGALTYVPLVQAKYWTIDIDRLTVGNEKLIGPSKAVLDTGSTVIALPKEYLPKVHASLFPGSVHDDRLGWLVPCNPPKTKSQLTFWISGKEFKVPHRDLIREQVKSRDGYCFSSLVGTKDGVWLLGVAFLKSHYIVYDVGNLRVGLAPAAQA
ncbi:uncharacterized protein VTP21DRAFT_8809 [Calcarisporiella thermophila]|uniref:uncharacterized protein n=1 Tax=Calcarisporiella thermophila TaxID=911321 RepID=UPI0037448472